MTSTLPLTPSPTPAPFIVGVPRSGTTLLRMMLDAHTDLAIPPETHFLPSCAALQCGAETFVQRFVPRQIAEGPWMGRFLSEQLREQFFAVLTQLPYWGDFQLDRAEFQRAIGALVPFTVPDGVRCFYRAYATRHGKARWGDKTPGYQLFMPVITYLLPEARFIHLVRDPRAVALSHKEQRQWGAATEAAAVAALWRASIAEAQRQVSSGAAVLELRYEDLVADPEPPLRRVCAFVGLPFEQQMLQYATQAATRLEELSDSVTVAGGISRSRADKLARHEHLMQPPDVSRLERWRRELPADDRQIVEQIAGDLLDLFGYA